MKIQKAALWISVAAVVIAAIPLIRFRRVAPPVVNPVSSLESPPQATQPD
jgi:hypothetical protein